LLDALTILSIIFHGLIVGCEGIDILPFFLVECRSEENSHTSVQSLPLEFGTHGFPFFPVMPLPELNRFIDKYGILI
jgi:hypothetical protein